MLQCKPVHIALLLLSTFLLHSCTYRFSNLYLRPPAGISTIAIEAIYDTSRDPLPHDILWANLQQEFAANGRLRLASSDVADAYLRVHLRDSLLLQNNLMTIEKITDPTSIIDPSTGEANPLTNYNNLREADQYSKNESMSMALDVEVWDLKSGLQIMKRTYPMSGNYAIFDGKTPRALQFLKAEEGFSTQFDAIAKGTAKAIVNDFLSIL